MTTHEQHSVVLEDELQQAHPAPPALEETWLPDYGDEILVDEDRVLPGARVRDVARCISWQGAYRVQDLPPEELDKFQQ